MSLPSPAEDASESAVDTFVGRVLELRYRVEEKLGEGGLGTVYRAQHLKLARRVAIKVLRDDLRGIPQIRARFEREVRALSSLSHPNVVTITDFGISDGVPFLVMELAEGIELAKMVGEPLPPVRALWIIRQILASLAYAHEREVVHRDLKPANVIVRSLPDGRDHVTVLDFGLAKFVGDDAGADLTRSGLVVGTPAYMPPEQMAAGARKADARSDLYAAGLILFELLAGRRPFQFDEPAELLRAHLVQEPPSLAEALAASWVDPRVETILSRALAKVPDERFQTAREMIDAIDALPTDGLVRGGTGPREVRKDSTRPARPTPISAEARQGRSAERARSMGMRAGVAALAFLFCVAGIAWAVRRAEPEAPVVTANDAASAGEPATAVAPPDPETAPVIAPAGAGEEEDAQDEELEAEVDVAIEDDVVPSVDVAAEAQAIAAETQGEVTEEPPFVPPPQVGPRVASRNPLRGRMPRLLSRVHARLEHGRGVGQSDLRALTRYRNEHPQDPRARLLLGHAYMQRGWFSHAIEQYERAMAIDMGARGNPQLLTNLLRAARTETLAARASEMVSRIYGAEASRELQRQLARTHDEGERARLQALAAMLGPS